VVAVSVEQGVAGELRKLCVGSEILLEELAQEECLLAESLGAFVVGEQINEFVAEDGDAAWFEADNGDSGRDLGLELVEDFEKQTFGAVEHAEIVEGASAAEIRTGDQDTESGGFEDLDGGFRRGW
jgi:hypothetical protein